ncbi:glycolipid transfer protein-like [Phyllopteryx taeniolatus]|uniref:glycolipid transfer protein-like n=1 Tax=Phycodurus eques TaxID=693459 RepID=UPI002ACE79AF|nr:glycolipid transfer protein-like [Phycodurus eques]XP_061655425.1 glycolipid transfer protein-like [Phyllopteryx taeniolatus]
MSLLLDNRFCELPTDNSVNTKLFLETVSHLPSFFDCLGSKVFSLIKSDINGNITKIKEVYVKDPQRYVTLQHILEAERQDLAAEWPKAGATLALMWLKRGLRFIQILLQSLVDGERDLNQPNHIRINVTKAYEQALKRYHGWFVQKIFNTALYAAPYRSNFLKALSKGEDVKEEECLENVRHFLVNYAATVDAIHEMYARLDAELDYTV